MQCHDQLKDPREKENEGTCLGFLRVHNLHWGTRWGVGAVGVIIFRLYCGVVFSMSTPQSKASVLNVSRKREDCVYLFLSRWPQEQPKAWPFIDYFQKFGGWRFAAEIWMERKSMCKEAVEESPNSGVPGAQPGRHRIGATPGRMTWKQLPKWDGATGVTKQCTYSQFFFGSAICSTGLRSRLTLRQLRGEGVYRKLFFCLNLQLVTFWPFNSFTGLFPFVLE